MFKNNIIKTGIICVLIATLAVGVAIPVAADSSTPAVTSTTTAPVLTTVQGIVTAVNPSPSATTPSTFTLNTSTTPVKVDSNTKYYVISVGAVAAYVDNKVDQDNNNQSTATKLKNLHIPANWKDNLGFLDTFAKAGAFSDIAVGDRVIARVNSSGVAAQVLIIKVPAVKQARGTVAVGTDGSITVTNSTTTVPPLKWDNTTEFIIKGNPSLPISKYGVVTYNSTTDVASLVNLTVIEPVTPATATTTTTTTTTSTTSTSR